MKRGKLGFWFEKVSLVVILVGMLALIGCGGGGGDGGSTAASSYSISGKTSDSTGIGLSEVTVTLTGVGSPSTLTDANGNFLFSGVANGNYTLSASKVGYTITPANIPVAVNGANLTGQNFAGNIPAKSISITPIGLGESILVTNTNPITIIGVAESDIGINKV